MQKIRNIIFDLGGVLLDIDVDRTLTAFDKIGIPGTRLTEIYEKPGNFFKLFEKGAMDAAAFRNSLRALSDNHIPDAKIDDAWNAMVTGFPKDKIELLLQLRSKYRIILLSNTNEIHVPVYSQQFKEITGGMGIEEVFHRVYYSHVLALSKPDPMIYYHVLQDMRISGTESLFIDDLAENVEAAYGAGIIACQYLLVEDLTEVVRRHGITW